MVHACIHCPAALSVVGKALMEQQVQEAKLSFAPLWVLLRHPAERPLSLPLRLVLEA